MKIQNCLILKMQNLLSNCVPKLEYSIFWMVIFGGAGIRHEREASNLGLCCNKPENGNFFLAANETQTIIADRGIESEKM